MAESAIRQEEISGLKTKINKISLMDRNALRSRACPSLDFFQNCGDFIEIFETLALLVQTVCGQFPPENFVVTTVFNFSSSSDS